MQSFLTERGWWSAEKEEETKKEFRSAVIKAMGQAEKKLKPSLSSMFENIYEEIPPHLQDQRAELARLVGMYGKSEGWAKELKKHVDHGEDLTPFRSK